MVERDGKLSMKSPTFEAPPPVTPTVSDLHTDIGLVGPGAERYLDQPLEPTAENPDIDRGQSVWVGSRVVPDSVRVADRERKKRLGVE